MITNATTREFLKQKKVEIATQKFDMSYQDAQDKQYRALAAYQDRKQKKANADHRREQYNLSVSNVHQ